MAKMLAGAAIDVDTPLCFICSRGVIALLWFQHMLTRGALQRMSYDMRVSVGRERAVYVYCQARSRVARYQYRARYAARQRVCPRYDMSAAARVVIA